jgi:hypothetical protein
MYNEKILKASSWKDRSIQSGDQSCTEGISSGMKRPPSFASPLSTTSSNESYDVLVFVTCGSAPSATNIV